MATGGTIASTGDYYGDRGGGTHAVTAGQLIAAAPGIDAVAQLSAEQFSNVGSSAIGPTQWLALARRINEAFHDDSGVAGIVVTHGTDTMEETAFFLDLTVAGDRPVVVTGSMRPADGIGADGPANLFNAVRMAAAPGSRGYGAMVVMNDHAYAAREVTKTNTSRVDTFQAPEHGPLAVTDHDTLVFNRERPTRRLTFDISHASTLPRVDIVYVYAGADSLLIDAAIAGGDRGIVVAGVGDGKPTPAQLVALRRAKEKGVVVVMTSRTGSGRVNPNQEFVPAGDLNAQKARVLLMLALTRSNDPAAVRATFGQFLGW